MLSAVALSFFTLTRDNGWGDDFAGYIMQARSIVRGDMGALVAANIRAIERSSGDLAPANYPWGFPLMLAPVYALFGTKVLALKLVLTLCHALLVLAAFLLGRTRLNALDSLLLAAVIAYNAVLITEGQGEVLSDIPFTVFSTAALWLIVRQAAASTREADVGRGVLTGLGIFMALFIRPNGFLLLVPLVAMHIPGLQNKDSATRRSAALAICVPVMTVGLLYALQAWIFPSASTRAVSFSLSPGSVSSMVLYYLPMPAYFFRHLGPAAWVIYGIQILLIVLGVLAHWRRDLPLHMYVVATLLLYIAFPYRQGIRYLYPIWPVLLLFTFDGLHVLAGRLNSAPSRTLVILFRALCCAMVALSLVVCVGIAHTNMLHNRNAPAPRWGAFSTAANNMFDFIHHHTPSDSVVIFFKPRAMRLRTDRDSFIATKCSQLSQGDYLVEVEDGGSYDQIAPESLKYCDPQILLTPIYEKDLFIIYPIQHVR